jgi:hypothetical protein
VSQTLTLYVTPVFYIYMEHLQGWLARRKVASHAAIAPEGLANGRLPSSAGK